MRDHILRVAEDLFYREGIRAVGIDRIISEAGVAKATLYAKFPSKHDLVAAYLKARSERVLDRVRANLEEFQGSDTHKIISLFEELKRASEPGSPFRGCAFMLAVAENAGDTSIRDIAIDHKESFREIFFDILSNSFDDAESKSRQIAICYEGALTSIALFGNNDSISDAIKCTEAILA